MEHTLRWFWGKADEQLSCLARKPSMRNKIGKDSMRSVLAAGYASLAISQGFDFLFYLLLFRALPVASVGSYSAVMAVMTFVVLTIDMGISPGLTREFAGARWPGAV